MDVSDIRGSVAEVEQNGESKDVPKTPKALLIVIIVMGILIILGTVGLVWVVAHRMMHHSTVLPEPTVQSASMLSSPSVLAIVRRQGEEIRSVTARPDGALAVMMMTSQGDGRLVLWSPEQARILSELDIK